MMASIDQKRTLSTQTYFVSKVLENPGLVPGNGFLAGRIIGEPGPLFCNCGAKRARERGSGVGGWALPGASPCKDLVSKHDRVRSKNAVIVCRTILMNNSTLSTTGARRIESSALHSEIGAFA